MSLIISNSENAVSVKAGDTVDISSPINSVNVLDANKSLNITDSLASLKIVNETNNIVVSKGDMNLLVSVVGIQGGVGPQGLKGDPGGPVAYLDDLYDVEINTPANKQFVMFSTYANQWVNTNVIDGGNF